MQESNKLIREFSEGRNRYEKNKTEKNRYGEEQKTRSFYDTP